MSKLTLDVEPMIPTTEFLRLLLLLAILAGTEASPLVGSIVAPLTGPPPLPPVAPTETAP